MKDQHELEAMIMERLEEIKPVPERDSQTAARARAQFLSQAVSASEFQRHKGWRSIFRKEQFAMNMMISVVVLAGLLFGGGATAVGAAQNDLPGEPLYGVKTLSEDIGLQFQRDPEEKVHRLLELMQLRVQEMTQLTESGQTPPDSVRLRLEQHLQQTLQICDAMDDATLDRTLLQIRDQLREQDRELQRLQIHATQDAGPILERTHTLLQQRLHLVEDGLANHEAFRNAVRNGFRYGQEQEPTPPAQNGNGGGEPTPQPGGNGNGVGPGPNTDPGSSHPNVTHTPAANGNGDGSNSGSNNGNGSGNNDGGNNSSSGNQNSGGNGSGGNGSGGNDRGGKGK